MKLPLDPLLPRPGSPDFDGGLYQRLYTLFRTFAAQINTLAEGSLNAAHNAATAPPSAGTYAQGDTLRNKAPVEAGTAGSKYVITGWVCIAGGTPGTWREMRCLTGN